MNNTKASEILHESRGGEDSLVSQPPDERIHACISIFQMTEPHPALTREYPRLHAFMGLPLINVFFSYAPADGKLRDDLAKHLTILQRQNIITMWHDKQIMPGANKQTTINEHLMRSDIALILISPDFFASDYCFSEEMQLIKMSGHIASPGVD